MTESDYQPYERTANGIADALKRWEAIQGNSRYDKKGFGVNRDSRFSSATLKLSLDSWAGEYGTPSCSRVLSIHSDEVFREAFTRVVEDRLLELLAETATQIKATSATLRADEIRTLRQRLESLEADG